MQPAPHGIVTTSDGVDIAFYELGGSGPPIVLAHATGFHGMAFEPLARRLANRYRCVAIDERGHGLSGVPLDLDFDWHGFATDVLAVVDALGLERPLGVGHSAGGAALLLAEERRPGTFEALYCFEPIVPIAGDEPPAEAVRATTSSSRRREVFATKREAYEIYAGKPPFSSFDPEALDAYVTHGFEDLPDGTVRLRCRRDNETRVYERAAEHDGYANLGRVACPVTLACGEITISTPRSQLERLAPHIARVRVEELKGLNHLGPLEDPARIAAAIDAAFDDPPS
jgi:pimeloyl-ACP methyl ester carboxylesterase